MILGATSLVLRRAGAAVSLRHSTTTAQRSRSRARSTARASTDAGG